MIKRKACAIFSFQAVSFGSNCAFGKKTTRLMNDRIPLSWHTTLYGAYT
jgi:hypothetical protein